MYSNLRPTKPETTLKDLTLCKFLSFTMKVQVITILTSFILREGRDGTLNLFDFFFSLYTLLTKVCDLLSVMSSH